MVQMGASNIRALIFVILLVEFHLPLSRQAIPVQQNPCTGERAPDCRRLNSPFRTLNGVCNNLDRPFLGATNTPFRRLIPPDYADGRSHPRQSQVRGVPLPNPRTVSLLTFRDEDRQSPRLSHMAMVFGQFLAHDLTLGGLPEGVECETERFCQRSGECVGIPINPPEQTARHIFDPRFPGPENVRCIQVIREAPCNNRLPREQVNILTAFIDGSHIYGVNEEELDDISNDRSLLPLGLLATVPQNISFLENLLPTADPRTLCRSPDPINRPCFVSGDFRRNNENQALNSLHTVWVREHNRVALQLHFLNPTWSGIRLFQESRRIIGAMMQHITYNEFLPLMVGPVNVRRFGLELLSGRQRFRGYDPNVDPSLPNSMAAAALRFGHSTVRNQFSRVGRFFRHFPDINVKEFHNPEFLYEVENGGIDSILRGLTIDRAQNIDGFFSDSILNNVIPEEGVIGDLMAINIQRARERGVPGYNRFRQFCQLPRARTFDDFRDTIPNFSRRDALRRTYQSVDDVDLFVGGMFEAPSPSGGGLGPTFACILGNGFRGLRVGDRFWYETDQRPVQFTLDQLETMRNASLARIICDNTDDIEQIQPRVMQRRFDNIIGGGINRPVECSALPFVNLNAWKE